MQRTCMAHAYLMDMGLDPALLQNACKLLIGVVAHSNGLG